MLLLLLANRRAQPTQKPADRFNYLGALARAGSGPYQDPTIARMALRVRKPKRRW